MSKEGYSVKGCTAYHGEPLGSATKKQGNAMAKRPGSDAPYKGSVTSYQGKPLDSATRGRGK